MARRAAKKKGEHILNQAASTLHLVHSDPQPDSNRESEIAASLDPLMARAPMNATVPIEFVRSKKSAGAAFSLACDASGLDDKEIYMALGIDAGYFSNIKKGRANLQGDKLRDFCAVVGNRIFPEWMAFQVDCTLVLVKSEAERRAEVAEARADNLQRELDMLRNLIRSKVEA